MDLIVNGKIVSVEDSQYNKIINVEKANKVLINVKEIYNETDKKTNRIIDIKEMYYPES